MSALVTSLGRTRSSASAASRFPNVSSELRSCANRAYSRWMLVLVGVVLSVDATLAEGGVGQQSFLTSGAMQARGCRLLALAVD